MSVQEQKLLLIGEIEAQSGIPIQTIRYYEDLGLLKPSGRTAGGFRQFSSKVLDRLAFIKRAKSLGLTLQEIRAILAVYDQGIAPCDAVKELLQNHLVQVEQQIQELVTLRTQLVELLSYSQNSPDGGEGVICSIIQKPSERPTQTVKTVKSQVKK